MNELEEIASELNDLEDYLSILEAPDPLQPCSEASVLAGCTCRMKTVDSASIQPPEPVIARDCPLHGHEIR